MNLRQSAGLFSEYNPRESFFYPSITQRVRWVRDSLVIAVSLLSYGVGLRRFLKASLFIASIILAACF